MNNDDLEHALNAPPQPYVSPTSADYTAGRIAGLREAAEAIQAFVSIPADGTMTDDMAQGIARGASYCAVQNQIAIFALAEKP